MMHTLTAYTKNANTKRTYSAEVVCDVRNMTSDSGDLVDDTDFCRTCDGKGDIKEYSHDGRWVSEDCHMCRGTGLRTVIRGR